MESFLFGTQINEFRELLQNIQATLAQLSIKIDALTIKIENKIASEDSDVEMPSVPYNQYNHSC